MLIPIEEAELDNSDWISKLRSTWNTYVIETVRSRERWEEFGGRVKLLLVVGLAV